MRLDTSEVLACPTCGPPTGLIVRVDEADGRRVRCGLLACPFCAGRFEIEDGWARLGPVRLGDTSGSPPQTTGDPTTLAAAIADLGGTIGPVLIDAGLGVDPERLARIAPRIVPIFLSAVSPGAPSLPILAGRLAAAAVRSDGPLAPGEISRTVVPGGRIAAIGPDPEDRWSREPGLRVLARDDRAVALVRDA